MLKDKKETGGPAFPIMDAQTVHRIGALACEGLTDPHEKDQAYYVATVAAASGMTLRDYFAAKSLPAAMTICWADIGYPPIDGLNDMQQNARLAYQMADAMLVERAK